MKKKIISGMVLMLLVVVGLSGCVNEQHEPPPTEDTNTDSSEEYRFYYKNITVIDAGNQNYTITGANNRKMGYWHRTYIKSNATTYYLDYSNVTMLIGKKLFIQYHYPNPKFYNTFGEESKGEPIQLEPHLDNYTIVEDTVVDEAFHKFSEYIKNRCRELQISSGVFNIVLPVLDEYGRNIHYKTSLEVEISNPCNISTHLKTNLSDFNIYNPIVEIVLPGDLNNNYFVITYPDRIELNAFESKTYLISIEVYGSGANQVFFPKGYAIRFFISNGFIGSTFVINVMFDDMDWERE